LLGSFERFIGILIEHYAGEFPLWLSPTQAVLLTIADRHNDAAHQFAAQLRDAGVRVKVDDRTESVGRKIREAEISKTPYMLVIGDAEIDSGSVAVRRHKEGDIGTFTISDFAQKIADDVATERSLEPPVVAAAAD
jgi:threonyl-tRNA synthetase